MEFIKVLWLTFVHVPHGTHNSIKISARHEHIQLKGAPLWGLITFFNPLTGEAVEASGFGTLNLMDSIPLIKEEEGQ